MNFCVADFYCFASKAAKKNKLITFADYMLKESELDILQQQLQKAEEFYKQNKSKLNNQQKHKIRTKIEELKSKVQEEIQPIMKFEGKEISYPYIHEMKQQMR